MSSYLSHLLELACDPSTHAMVATVAWLTWRVERIARMVAAHGERTTQLELKVARLERDRQLEAW